MVNWFNWDNWLLNCPISRQGWCLQYKIALETQNPIGNCQSISPHLLFGLKSIQLVNIPNVKAISHQFSGRWALCLVLAIQLAWIYLCQSTNLYVTGGGNYAMVIYPKMARAIQISTLLCRAVSSLQLQNWAGTRLRVSS